MTTFDTKCSHPQTTVNFVSGPDTRGTLDILWPCLSVLVLCTYTSLHLNVPPQELPKGKHAKFKRILLRTLTKLEWMMFAILAPEYILGKAYSDRISAKLHLPEYKKIAEKDKVEWSASHVFLANMGGVTVTFNPEQLGAVNDEDAELHEDPPQSSESASAAIEGTASPASVNAADGDVNLLASSRTRDSLEIRPVSPARAGSEHNVTEANGNLLGHPQASDSIEMEPLSPAGAALQQRPQTPPEESPEPPPALNSTANHPPPALASGPTICEVKPGIRGSRAHRDASEGQVSNEDISDFTEKHNIWKNDAAESGRVTNEITTRIGEARKHTQTATFKSDWEKAHYVRSWRYWCQNLQALDSNVWVLDACQLLLARNMGIVTSLPHLSKDELDDRIQSDVVAKSLALGQLAWLLFQILVRAAGSLPVSQLEIVTLAFAFCTFATYIFVWDQPQGIETTVKVNADRYPTTEELARIAINGPNTWGRKRTSHWMANNSCHCDGKMPSDHNARMSLAAAGGAGLFGVFQLIAWEFSFPTTTERYFWKIASLVTLLMIPCGIALSDVLSLALRPFTRSRKHEVIATRVFVAAAILPYVVARIYVTFEMFRCLCLADPRIFVSTWTVNLPHIG